MADRGSFVYDFFLSSTYTDGYPMPNDPENRRRSPAELIDEICDLFEQGWRAGKPPAIEDLLQAAPEAVRPALYHELQAIERGYLDKGGRKLIPQQAADRNLLFGILALQMNFINSDALIAAMHTWVIDKQKPLGQILSAQGKLSAGQLHALEALISEHLKVQVDDHENSFQSCIPVHSLAKLFASIEDADVRTSISNIGSSSGNDATGSFHPVRGSKVGRYVRKDLYKKGGLGEVFFADDTELNREVALKEIKEQNADNIDYQLRFRIEAEITGGLEHPGIVPVYGLGLYPNGRPFYAMRFIRGETLKDAIDSFHAAEKPGRDVGERSLALRQLLRRYVDVCNAVAYAHSRGVLHRDIKPSNIMLGKYGETLVVDWGLAKTGVRKQSTGNGNGEIEFERTLRPSSGSSADPTRAGAILGTVPYMSPEQAAGKLEELCPASDIYSLGSTLYMLLTGKKPYNNPDESELLSEVRTGRFTPIREAKVDVPTVLAAICEKAMSLKPVERYGTALQLAADVEHWLADEPVSAYPEPWTMRAGRWMRRHRSWVVGAVVFLVSAVVALSVSTGLVLAEQRKTETQKDKALRNFLLTRELSFNSIDLFESAEVDLATKPQLHARRKEILLTACKSYEHMLEEEPGNLEIWRHAAKIFRYTANVHRVENETIPAIALYRQSIQLQQKVIEKQPDDVESQLQLANTLRDMANLHSLLGKLREAKNDLDKSVELSENIYKKDNDKTSALRAMALAQLELSAIVISLGEVDQSKKTASDAAASFSALQKLPSATGPYDPLFYAASLNRAAVAEGELGKTEDAAKNHSQSIKVLIGMRSNPPQGVAMQDIEHMFAWCLLDQAKTIAKIPEKRTKALDKNLSASVEIWMNLTTRFPKVRHYPAFQARALLARAQLRWDTKMLNESKRDYEEAVRLLKTMVENFQDLAPYSADLGRAYLGLARHYVHEGNRVKADDNYELAAEALSKAAELSPEDMDINRSLKEVRKERKN